MQSDYIQLEGIMPGLNRTTFLYIHPSKVLLYMLGVENIKSVEGLFAVEILNPGLSCLTFYQSLTITLYIPKPWV